MPYSGPNELYVRPTADFQLTYTNDGIPPSEFSSTNSGTIDSLNPTYKWYDMRDGTNSSMPDLMRVFGADNYELVRRKRRIGWEYKYEKKRTYFTDPKGRRRYREKTVRKRLPLFTFFYKLIIKKRAKHVQTEFLRPNILRYRLGYSYLTPQNLPVTFKDVWMPVGKYSGYYNVTGPGGYKAPGYYAPGLTVGSSLTLPPAILHPIDGLNEAALRGLYTKVYSDLPDYFTATAELPELLRLVKDTVLESVKLAKEIYRLDVKRLSKRLDYKVTEKDLSQLWLTYIYGIMPVLSDVQDTIKIISREARTWRTYTRKETDVVSYDDMDHTPLNYSKPITETFTNSSTWGCIVEGRMSVLDYLNRASHWQKTAATVYEVIPFSFMLDWIADISGYLNACQIFEGLSYHAWNSFSYKRKYDFTGRFVYNPDYPLNGKWSSPLFSTGTLSFAMNRDLVSVLPDMPDIVVTKPALDLSSINRAISSLAILLVNGDRIPKKALDIL